MITVELKDLLFEGLHGVHAEEQLVGNRYTVNCRIQYRESLDVITHIEDTVNYVDVYDIIKQKMQKPVPLLETLAMECGFAIQALFPTIAAIEISIEKQNPPIAGMRGRVGVTWHKHFDRPLM